MKLEKNDNNTLTRFKVFILFYFRRTPCENVFLLNNKTRKNNIYSIIKN